MFSLHCVLQVEGLLDDKDFKAKVTRAEFEELCEDLFARISKPVEDAMKLSEYTWVWFLPGGGISKTLMSS